LNSKRLWPVFDTSTKVLMQNFYRIREAKADTTKAEALRQAQMRLLRGETTLEGVTAKPATADRKIFHEEEKPGAANKAVFKLMRRSRMPILTTGHRLF